MSIQEIIDKYQYNGVILITKGDQILFQEAYGFADIENHIPLTTKTKLRIASVSKQMTAVAILLLAYQQKLSLQDTLDQYFENVPYKTPITIHQLLANCSGLPAYDLYGDYSEYLTQESFYQVFIENVIFPKPLECEPGSKFEYNGSSYVVLTRIIEIVSGLDYDSFMIKHIFEPLRMNDSGFDFGIELPNKAIPYDKEGTDIIPAKQLDLRLGGGGGGLYSTLEDMYKWNQSILQFKLLPKEWIDKLFEQYIPVNEVVWYGYGMFLADVPNGTPPVKYYYHTGGGPGVRSVNNFFINHKIELVMITNINDRDMFEGTRSELYSLIENGGII